MAEIIGTVANGFLGLANGIGNRGRHEYSPHRYNIERPTNVKPIEVLLKENDIIYRNSPDEKTKQRAVKQFLDWLKEELTNRDRHIEILCDDYINNSENIAKSNDLSIMLDDEIKKTKSRHGNNAPLTDRLSIMKERLSIMKRKIESLNAPVESSRSRSRSSSIHRVEQRVRDDRSRSKTRTHEITPIVIQKADEETSLPEGWQRIWAKEKQKYYYKNTATGNKTWTRPTIVTQKTKRGRYEPEEEPPTLYVHYNNGKYYEIVQQRDASYTRKSNSYDRLPEGGTAISYEEYKRHGKTSSRGKTSRRGGNKKQTKKSTSYKRRTIRKKY